MNILIIEDDARVADFLSRGLRAEGYRVQHARTGPDGLQLAREGEHALLLLDVMLPGMTGLELCQTLRAECNHVPILMLTALSDVDDRVAGLRLGADDYLTKPFAFEELLARLHALLRRPRQLQVLHLQLADLRIDLLAHEVMRDGQRLDLTQKEYAVLVLLVRHSGQVVSRQQLAEEVWHADLIAIDNLMDVHIKNLRRKIEADGRPALIETLRGQGFRMRGDGAP